MLLLFITLRVLSNRIVSGTDDSHIFQMLAFKFGFDDVDSASFHVSMYAMQVEFQALSGHIVSKLAWSGLLPASFLAVLFVSFKALVSLKEQHEVKIRDVENATYIIICASASCYAIMSGMMMRFVALGVPHACLAAAVLPVSLSKHAKFRIPLAVLLMVFSVWNGWIGLLETIYKMPSPASRSQIDATQWILRNTAREDVIASGMATSAVVKLATGRPSIIHPQYENKELREMVMNMAVLFASRSVSAVHAIMRRHGAKYAILDDNRCYAHVADGRKYTNIIDSGLRHAEQHEGVDYGEASKDGRSFASSSTTRIRACLRGCFVLNT